MPSDLLSAQLLIGVVVVLLAIVGIAFFARSGGRGAQAPAPGAAPATPTAVPGSTDPAGTDPAAPAAATAATAGEASVAATAGEADPGGDDPAARSGPGTYRPIRPVGSASVFETEPCWVSLLPGWARGTAPDAGSGSGGAADDPTTGAAGAAGSGPAADAGA